MNTKAEIARLLCQWRFGDDSDDMEWNRGREYEWQSCLALAERIRGIVEKEFTARE